MRLQVSINKNFLIWLWGWFWRKKEIRWNDPQSGLLKSFSCRLLNLGAPYPHDFFKLDGAAREYDWVITWQVWQTVSRCFDKNMFVLKTLFIISNTRVWCFNVSMFSKYKLKLLSALKPSQKAARLKKRARLHLSLCTSFFWSWVTAKYLQVLVPLPRYHLKMETLSKNKY